MKRRISGVLLSLLTLLSLTSCGEIQGAHSASITAVYGEGAFLPGASNDQLFAVIPEGESPEENQAPSNADQDRDEEKGSQPNGKSDEGNASVEEDGWYTSKEEVALYIHQYDKLPGNYVTKAEAEAAGWSGGNVERYTGEGTAIGGSYFGNYEGLLPKAQGRIYAECDIDTVGENARGAKRIVFSNDGLIYYTEDHYETFELLYGTP